MELPAVVGAAASAVDAAEEHREDAVHRGEEGSAGAGLAVDGAHREDAALEVEAVAVVVVDDGDVERAKRRAHPKWRTRVRHQTLSTILSDPLSI